MSESKLCLSFSLVIMLPRPEDIRFLGDGDMILTLPVDPKKWKNEGDQKLNYLGRKKLLGEKKIKFEKKVIENTGFGIELLPDGIDSQIIYAKNYIPLCLVRLHHPELDSIPVPVVTYVRCTELLDIIRKVGWIEERRLAGRFCCSHVPHFSGHWCTLFVPEDPGDKIQEEQKKLGKLLEIEKKTTKWEVGGIYILPSRHQILYLGKLTEKPGISCYRTFDTPGLYLTQELESYYIEVEEKKVTYSVFLDITSQGMQDWVRSVKGKTVLEALQSYLLTSSNPYPNLRFFPGTKKPAALKESGYLKDVPGLDNFITGFFSDNINPEQLIPVRYEKLRETEKIVVDDYVKSKIKNWVSMYGNRSSYLKTKYKDIKTSEDLLDYIKNYCGKYPSNGIRNLMLWIGEEELTRLAVDVLGS